MSVTEQHFSTQGRQTSSKRNRRTKWLSALRRDRSLYLLALPGILFFLVFKYIPMWGIVIAFQDYSLSGEFRAVSGLGYSTLPPCLPIQTLPCCFEIHWQSAC